MGVVVGGRGVLCGRVVGRVARTPPPRWAPAALAAAFRVQTTRRPEAKKAARQAAAAWAEDAAVRQPHHSPCSVLRGRRTATIPIPSHRSSGAFFRASRAAAGPAARGEAGSRRADPAELSPHLGTVSSSGGDRM
ncbi:hypothetical protein GCM10022205_14060 [Spinactinospora alkalitolerans]